MIKSNGNGGKRHVGLRKYKADPYSGIHYPGMAALHRFAQEREMTPTAIHNNGGPVPGTTFNYFRRKTRRPNLATFNAAVRAAGGRCYDPVSRRILTDADIRG